MNIETLSHIFAVLQQCSRFFVRILLIGLLPATEDSHNIATVIKIYTTKLSLSCALFMNCDPYRREIKDIKQLSNLSIPLTSSFRWNLFGLKERAYENMTKFAIALLKTFVFRCPSVCSQFSHTIRLLRKRFNSIKFPLFLITIFCRRIENHRYTKHALIICICSFVQCM